MARTQSTRESHGQYTWQRDGFEFPYDALSGGRRLKTLRQELEAGRSAGRRRPRVVALFAGLHRSAMLPGFDKTRAQSTHLGSGRSHFGPEPVGLGLAAFLSKRHKTTSFVSWHQDLNYWGLDGADEVTAWVALSPALIPSGCMRFVPGSHKSRRSAARRHFAIRTICSLEGKQFQSDIDESAGGGHRAASRASSHCITAICCMRRTPTPQLRSAYRRRDPLHLAFDGASFAGTRRSSRWCAVKTHTSHFELAPEARRAAFQKEMIELCRTAVARKENILYERRLEQAGRRVNA